jgi:glycosyltransferase involved in cell wall biosynthesis
MFSPCRQTSGARYSHVHLPMSGSLRTVRWATRLRKSDLSGFDVFHAHGNDFLPLGKAMPPQVRTMHGSCLAEACHIGGTKERLRMMVLGLGEVASSLGVRATVAISDNTTRWYPWIHHVIPNGVDRGLFRPGPKDPDPTIVFVGTYRGRKRGDLLMEAFASEVLPAHPTARLLMVCSDAPRAPHVEVLGELSDEDLANRLRRAWLFCLPSSYEGFGVPYIEAMASGTAVVATPNAGAREILVDGRFGVVVAPSNLGCALRDLLSDQVRRNELASVGVRRAAAFDSIVVAEAYEALYAQVTGRTMSRSHAGESASTATSDPAPDARPRHDADRPG